MLVCAALVHGPGPPFTYRIGQRPDRQLRVNVKEFRIRNQTKTSNERQAAADQVPPSLVNDPGPIQRAGRAARRPDHRGREIGSTGRLARKCPIGLEADARELSRSQGGHRHSRAPRQPARADRGRVRAACFATACLGPDTLPPNEESSRLLSIRKVGEPASAARLVPRDRVVPERIVKPEGPVYQEFCSAFTSPRVGQILFGLIANQLDSTPTLVVRGRGHGPASRRGTRTASRTITTLMLAARCWSSRDRRSARSSSSCFVSSTTPPLAELGFGDWARRASSGSSPWWPPSISWPGSYVYRREPRFAREPGPGRDDLRAGDSGPGDRPHPGGTDLECRGGPGGDRRHDRGDRL